MILIFAIQLRQNSTFYTKPDFLNPPSSNDRYLPALLGILRAELVSIQSGTGAAPERGFFFYLLVFVSSGPERSRQWIHSSLASSRPSFQNDPKSERYHSLLFISEQ